MSSPALFNAMSRNLATVFIFTGMNIFFPFLSLAEDFTFEVDEFEKKALEAGGYAELKWEHFNFNDTGALSLLNGDDEPDDTLDRLSGTLQLSGSYVKGIGSLYWLLNGSGYLTEDEWDDSADLFEAYATLTPTDNLNGSLGKKAYKWGKGYAWNPVGFINRMKDPNNPDEALEGFVTAEMELIKSFDGNLQNLALTAVVLPVDDDINEDFGMQEGFNLAAKLYLLYLDTDIDLLFLTGDTRSSRFGVDFSRNITTNFEIHGEYGYSDNLTKTYVDQDGNAYGHEDSYHSYLLGIRHLTSFNLTSIIEYYHNGTGYTSDELQEFYKLIDSGATQYEETGLDTILDKARKLGQQGYTRPFLGTDYLYARFSLKEPWDILYFTPALTAIYNLDDHSITLTPELLYTGFTNWEIRLRFSMLYGEEYSEYGEKLNQNKLEARVRWFF